MTFQNRFQAVAAMVCLAIVGAVLGALIAFLGVPYVLLLEPDRLIVWLVFIAFYFAFAGLSAGVALSLHKLPHIGRLGFDRVESRVPGTFYQRCTVCGSHFIRTLPGELLPVINPDLPKEVSTK